jgi:membrane protein
MPQLHLLSTPSPTTARRPPHGARALLRALVREWGRVDASVLSAALAFYAVLSLMPFLLVVVAIVGSLLGSDAGTRYLLAQVRDIAGKDLAALVGGVLTHVHPLQAEGLRALLGLAATLFGATALFAHLQHGLDRVFGARWRGALRLVRARLLSFVLVVGVAVLVIASLGVSAGVTTVVSRIASFDLARAVVSAFMNELLSFVVLALAFAGILRVLPESPPRRRALWVGALVAAGLFVLGKFGIAWYLGHFALASAYGAAGAVVLLMLWIYGTCLLFFFGAVLAHTVDRLDGPALVGEALPSGAR